MESENNDLWPVLKPMPLPKTADYEYALWFVVSDITCTTEGTETSNEETTKSKVKSWVKNNIPNATFGSSGDLLVVPILMNQDDLGKHFATSEETGDYLPNVREPPGGRESWLRERYDEQQPKSRKIREVSGFASKVPGSYATPGGVGIIGAVPSTGGGGL
jgi:hypothetical protein